VDDTLRFYRTDPEQLWYLPCVLICFEVVLGLKINLGKSELVLVANVLNVIELANLVGCKVSRLPMKYLCLPLGSTFKAKAIWDSVVEKMERWFEFN
jgi:hypothetical protein